MVVVRANSSSSSSSSSISFAAHGRERRRLMAICPRREEKLFLLSRDLELVLFLRGNFFLCSGDRQTPDSGAHFFYFSFLASMHAVQSLFFCPIFFCCSVFLAGRSLKDNQDVLAPSQFLSKLERSYSSSVWINFLVNQ